MLKLLKKETLHRGVKFDLVAHTLQTAAGATIRRESIHHPGSVVVLPMLPGNRVVMVRNYRHTVDQILLELPAGTVEPNEPFEVTAARELTEETGYTAACWKKVS